jgi:hypothetical protein
MQMEHFAPFSTVLQTAHVLHPLCMPFYMFQSVYIVNIRRMKIFTWLDHKRWNLLGENNKNIPGWMAVSSHDAATLEKWPLASFAPLLADS